jgi:hypothetical protein
MENGKAKGRTRDTKRFGEEEKAETWRTRRHDERK